MPGNFLRDEDGAVTMIVALGLAVVLGCVAFAVDLGAGYAEKQRLQSVADLAALSAAAQVPDAANRALEVVSANPGRDVNIDAVSYGLYRGDPALTAAQRLTPTASGASTANAVSISLSSTVSMPFSALFRGSPDAAVRTTATAARQELAMFTLGSRLARLDPVALNTLVGNSIGTNLSLTLLDWQGLANADVTLADFLDALSVRSAIQVADYRDLLAARVDMRNVFGALSDVATAQGQTAAAATLLRLRNSAASTTIAVSALLSLEQGVTDLFLADVLNQTQVSALDTVRASADVLNADRIIEIPNLSLAIPGVTRVDVKLLVGERKQSSGWVSVGFQGAILHTAQVRLWLNLTLAPNLLSGLPVGAKVLTVRLPLQAEVAAASASLTAMNCRNAGGTGRVASFDTRNGDGAGSLVHAYLGQFSTANGAAPSPGAKPDFTPLVDLELRLRLLLIDVVVPLVTIEGRASVGVGQPSVSTVHFSGTEGLPATRRFGSDALVGSALTSLFASGNLDLRTAPNSLLGIVLAPVLALITNTRAALGPALNTAVTPLIDPILDGVTQTLGLTLAEADLTLLGTACRLDLIR